MPLTITVYSVENPFLNITCARTHTQTDYSIFYTNNKTVYKHKINFIYQTSILIVFLTLYKSLETVSN